MHKPFHLSNVMRSAIGNDLKCSHCLMELAFDTHNQIVNGNMKQLNVLCGGGLLVGVQTVFDRFMEVASNVR